MWALSGKIREIPETGRTNQNFQRGQCAVVYGLETPTMATQCF